MAAINMGIFKILMVGALIMTPAITFAAASGGEKSGDKEKDGEALHLDDLPSVRAPALDDILDRARAKLEKKTERDIRRQRVLKSEADRKSKIEDRLERYLGADLPDVIPDSHKPGILPADKPSPGREKPTFARAPKFIPITTDDLKSAFSAAGGQGLRIHRTGNNVIVDLLCSEKNTGSLSKVLPGEKASDLHIKDARGRFCSSK